MTIPGTGLMIDVTGGSLDGLLAALGANLPNVIATYVTGTPDIDATSAQLARLHNLNVGVFLYDQSPGLALYGSGAADGADIERGAGSIGSFIDQTRKRAARGWFSWAYIDQADYPALVDAVASAGLVDVGHHVEYGIANWGDNLARARAELGADVSYVQWASPSSNPSTVVPGTTRTLAELNCDLNVTVGGWFAKRTPAPPPPAAAPAKGLLVTDISGNLTGQLVTSADGRTWKL